MTYDVLVIGGSYAGMPATLQLLRARRSVLVIDSASRWNRAAAHSHGFLGQDGVDPAELARQARAQLMRYPTLAWIEGEATSATGAKETFEVRCGVQVYSERRLLVATGVRDELPDIPGLHERWGRSVFHCPYCHGYELNVGRIGVIGTGPCRSIRRNSWPRGGRPPSFPTGRSNSMRSRRKLCHAGAYAWTRRGSKVSSALRNSC